MTELAQESAEVLRADERTLAVLLFGSVARGQGDENSDLDLLVLYRDQVPEETIDEIDERVSVSFYDWQRLKALPQRSPLFAIHLAHEGLTLFDPGDYFSAALDPVRPLSPKAASRLAAMTHHRLQQLLADPEAAPDDEITAGQLYALAKQAALLAAALRGEFEFDRKQAFEGLARTDRRFRADIEQVARLEPAWLSTRPIYPGDWAQRGSVDREVVAAAVRVIERVTDVGT